MNQYAKTFILIKIKNLIKNRNKINDQIKTDL